MGATPAFRVDTNSSTHPFQQIKDQIEKHRESGALPAGQRLPTVRQLAAELGLAPNTVARAFRELEACVFVETRGRRGSSVTGSSESAPKQTTAAVREYLTRVRLLRLSSDNAIEVLQEVVASTS